MTFQQDCWQIVRPRQGVDDSHIAAAVRALANGKSIVDIVQLLDEIEGAEIHGKTGALRRQLNEWANDESDVFAVTA